MDAANDLALKSVGKRRAETFAQHFFSRHFRNEKGRYLLLIDAGGKEQDGQMAD